MQAEAEKIITDLLKKPTKNALNIELFWELLSKGRERQKLFSGYNMEHGMITDYLSDLNLTYYPLTHNYNLENSGNFNFVTPYTRTVTYFNSLTLNNLVME